MGTFYATYPQKGSGGGSAGVSSLNGLTGAVNLVPGSGITITPSGNTVTIAQTGGGTSYMVDTYTLSSTDITNKAVILSAVPTTPAKVILTIASAPSQQYAVDFVIDSSLSPNKTLDWAGLGLDGILASGDFLMVQYY